MVSVGFGEAVVGYRPDGTPLRLRFWQAGSGAPRLFVAAAVHGDELTGVASLWMLREYVERLGSLRGSLTVMPVINVEGMSHGVRGIPGTLYDLNRLYPGDPRGSVAERIVYKVWEMARQHDYVVDLHTAGVSIPFVLLDPSPPATPKARAASEELAWSTGITILDEFPSEKYAKLGLQGSLPAVAVKEGIPSFTVELPSIDGYVDTRGVHVGFKVIRNIMSSLGMIDGGRAEIDEFPVIRERGLYRDTVPSESPGIIEYSVGLGDRVAAGALVARIRSPLGDVVGEVRAPRDMYIIALSRSRIAWSGGRVATAAYKKELGGR